MLVLENELFPLHSCKCMCTHCLLKINDEKRKVTIIPKSTTKAITVVALMYYQTYKDVCI